MRNNERQKHLNSIRKKLSSFIKQNRQLNLRDLSRKLKKNDAYLQQYISRGSPSFLPEEERKKLSDIINLDINLLTPNWLHVTTNNNEGLVIFQKYINNKKLKFHHLYLIIIKI